MINAERLVQTFLHLVAIDSPSGEEAKVADFLIKKLTALGLTVNTDSYGNVLGTLKGKGKPIMLNAHMDTVEPGRGIRPVIDGDIIKTNGKTILGSDPKAGLSIILETLETIVEQKIPHRPIEVVFTREEETSLGGAKNLAYSKISAKEGIVFDGDEEVFKIFVSSPSYYNIDVEITGRSAHAGVEPEKGISAIEIAGKLISKMQLGRIDSETTCNIGMITGGSVRNAVPETVRFHGEARSRNNKTLDKVIRNIEKICNNTLKEYKEAKVQLTLDKEFEGFRVKASHPLIKKATNALKKIGLTAELKDSGGASDANIFFTHNLEVIIVGTGVYEPHTTREHVIVSQMVDAARFCEEIVKE